MWKTLTHTGATHPPARSLQRSLWLPKFNVDSSVGIVGLPSMGRASRPSLCPGAPPVPHTCRTVTAWPLAAQAHCVWGDIHRALCILSPFTLLKTFPESSIPISQIQRWSLGKSCGWDGGTTHRGLGLPAAKSPASTTHLLRIVAVEVHLDSRVWDLLIDSYAFHGNPWTQSKAGNRLYSTGNTGLHPGLSSAPGPAPGSVHTSTTRTLGEGCDTLRAPSRSRAGRRAQGYGQDSGLHPTRAARPPPACPPPGAPHGRPRTRTTKAPGRPEEADQGGCAHEPMHCRHLCP